MPEREGLITALAVGHVTHDRYGRALRAGGCAFYAARVFGALGAHARVATAVGHNFARSDELAGLSVSASRGGKTVTFVNHYAPDGTRVQYVEGWAPPVEPDQVCSRWLRSRVVFLAPVLGEVDLDLWRRAVRPDVLGIGIQGLVKTAGPHLFVGASARTVVPRPWYPESAQLEGVDAAFLSVEDLEGQPGLLTRLVRLVPVVVLTSGRNGCDVFVRRRVAHVDACPARAVDPTGAGDTFAAAFLFALAAGAETLRAARLGAAAAAIVVEGRASDRLDRVHRAFERAGLGRSFEDLKADEPHTAKNWAAGQGR